MALDYWRRRDEALSAAWARSAGNTPGSLPGLLPFGGTINPAVGSAVVGEERQQERGQGGVGRLLRRLSSLVVGSEAAPAVGTASGPPRGTGPISRPTLDLALVTFAPSLPLLAVGPRVVCGPPALWLS